VVRAALAAALDDHYVLVHDLYLPGGEGDVDAAENSTCIDELLSVKQGTGYGAPGRRADDPVDHALHGGGGPTL